MTTTVFTDTVTPIISSWLNDVDTAAYKAIGTGTAVPTNASDVRTNLGLTASSGSSLVGFIQSGAGAVARTVQDKERESVSILDFGASTGASAAVNTIAIQAALNAAYRVYVPSGTYLTNTIVLQAGQTIYGDGITSVLKQNAITSGNATIYADSGSTSGFLQGITIRDIQVLGQVATLGFSQYDHLISLNGVKDAYIDNVFVTGFRGDGIYIGCSSAGATERHNKNVHINNCTIDGVNNDNRNGISVLDGDGIFITNNKFLNCTRNTMPGPVDFEPDTAGSYAWHVMRDCIVTGNHFDNCGGNVATVGFMLIGSASWTLKPAKFVVSNNTQVNPVGVANTSSFVSVLLGTDGATTVGNVAVHGNTVDAILSFNLQQVNGVSISGNVFNCASAGFIGYNSTDITKNVSITGNVFIGQNLSYGFVLRGTLSECVVSGNTITNALDGGILVGGSGSTISSLTIANNVFKNITGTSYSVLVGGGGLVNGSSCVFLGNTWSGTHNFPAWRTDDCGTISSGAAVVLASVVIANTTGNFTCTAGTLAVGNRIIISGTYGGTGSISGYADSTEYFIIATNGTTTFQLSTTRGGSAITTTAGTPTGLTYRIESDSFSSGTPPGSFPYGVSVISVNGDTGAPNVGGYQGVLTSYVQTQVGGTKYRYQTYNSANNTVGLGTTYIRRGSNSLNTWTAWYTITGV